MNISDNFLIVQWSDGEYVTSLNTVPDLDAVEYVPAFTQIAQFEHLNDLKIIPVWLMFPLNMELLPLDLVMAGIKANSYLNALDGDDLI